MEAVHGKSFQVYYFYYFVYQKVQQAASVISQAHNFADASNFSTTLSNNIATLFRNDRFTPKGSAPRAPS
jgi:hypothetical protein